MFANDTTPPRSLRRLVVYAIAEQAGWNRRGVNRLEPGAHQHQVGCTCRQKRNGERDVHSLAGCLEGRSHGGKNIRRFYAASLADLFCGIQELVYNSPPVPHPPRPPARNLTSEGAACCPTETQPQQARQAVFLKQTRAYGLFSDDAKLSKANPTEAKHARKSGLVVERPVLDNDYEIKSRRLDPQDDPARNQVEREAERKFQLSS